MSGNAHGLLGAYLAEQGLLPQRAPPRNSPAPRAITCIAPAASTSNSNSSDGKLDGVWIVGQAVEIFETEMSFD